MLRRGAIVVVWDVVVVRRRIVRLIGVSPLRFGIAIGLIGVGASPSSLGVSRLARGIGTGIEASSARV